jgi:hypothetical protein
MKNTIEDRPFLSLSFQLRVLTFGMCSPNQWMGCLSSTSALNFNVRAVLTGRDRDGECRSFSSFILQPTN